MIIIKIELDKILLNMISQYGICKSILEYTPNDIYPPFSIKHTDKLIYSDTDSIIIEKEWLLLIPK